MSGKCFYIGDSRMSSIGVMQETLHQKGDKTIDSEGNKQSIEGKNLTDMQKMKAFRKTATQVSGVSGKDGNYYYACGATDYSHWFQHNVDEIIEKVKGSDCDYVVINMGVNDWPDMKTDKDAKDLAKKYLDKAKRIEQDTGKRIVFAAPYPVSGNYYNTPEGRRDAVNKDLVRFKKYLKEGCENTSYGFEYLDLYKAILPYIDKKYIDKKSYWADGVHGGPELNKVILNYFQTELAKLSPVQAKTQTAQKTSPETTTTSRSDQENQSSTQSTNNTNENSQSSLNKIIDWFCQQLKPNESANNRDDKPNQQNNSQNLTEKQKNNMSRWAKRVGLSNDAVQGLIARYGDNAYDLMLKAMMEPHSLADYIGKSPRSSRKTIELLLVLDDEKAKKILQQYNLNGEVNIGAQTSSSIIKSNGSSSSESSTTSSDNSQTQRASSGNASGGLVQTRSFTESSINFNDSNVVNAFIKRAQQVGKLSPTEARETVSYIIQMSKGYGVDPCLALAVAETESGFRRNAVSPCGARGIMQLMPSTAKDLKVNPYNWRENVEGGIRLLAKNQNKYQGNYIHMLVAYNSGPGNLQKGSKSGLKGPELDRVTDRQCYAHKVISKVDEYRKLAGGNTGIYASYFGDQSINHYTVARSTGRRKKKKQTRSGNVAVARRRGGRA